MIINQIYGKILLQINKYLSAPRNQIHIRRDYVLFPLSLEATIVLLDSSINALIYLISIHTKSV